jgi:hypothetical protein
VDAAWSAEIVEQVLVLAQEEPVQVGSVIIVHV